MVAAPTLLPELDALTAEEAEGWIAAALAEARALHRYDDRLYPYGDDEEPMRRARRLHEAWRAWCDEADDLIERANAARGHVAGLHDLRYEARVMRAVIAMDPDEFRRRARRALNGETTLHGPEELRREIAERKAREQGRAEVELHRRG